MNGAAMLGAAWLGAAWLGEAGAVQYSRRHIGNGVSPSALTNSEG